ESYSEPRQDPSVCEFQLHLDVAWRVGCWQSTECGLGQIGIQPGEIGDIEGVEEVGLIAQPEPFVYVKVLTHGKVVGLQTGGLYVADRSISEPIIRCAGKGGLVHPVIDIPRAAAHEDVATQIVGPASADRGIAGYGVILACLQANDAIELPR